MSLANHLALQQATLQRFIDLLEQEQAALSVGSIDGELLAALAERKTNCLADIQRQETARCSVQQKLGYEDGHAGSERAALDAGCLPAWHALLSVAHRAKVLNEANGMMIQARHALNQRILTWLRQSSSADLYSPSGAAHRGSGSSISTQA